MIGRTVSHYRILEELGHGGMGVVYKAEDTRLRRDVALKFFPPGSLVDAGDKTRFAREARTAASIHDPHICTIHEIDTVGGDTFIAMTLLSGGSLVSRIERGPLPIDEALQIAIDVARGLAAAHAKGIVHRDIKPSNVLFDENDRAVITDFGLARATGDTRVTREGTTVGTIDYMSPEQAQGHEVDQPTDIWSLGVMLYEMLTGRLPFQADHAPAVVYQIINEEPPSVHDVRPEVPESVSRIVARAMAKEREHRYPGAREMLADLSRARRELGFAVSDGEERSALDGAASGRRMLNSRVWLAGALWTIAGLVLYNGVEWLVSHRPLSPHLPLFVLATFATLLPAVLMLGLRRSRGGLGRRSRAVTIGIPISVAVSALILAFLFHDKDLGAATTTVTVADDEGNAVRRMIPKGDFRKRLGIFFFDNASEDSSLSWLQYGFVLALHYDLEQDLFVSLGWGYEGAHQEAGFDRAVGSPLSLKQKAAGESHRTHFLTGSFDVAGDAYKVETTLYDTRKGRRLTAHSYTGSDVFALVDSMSIDIRRDLGVPEYQLKESVDLPVSDLTTGSMLAFERAARAYEKALLDNDFETSARLLEEAVETDPACAAAWWGLGDAYYFLNREEEAKRAYRQAVKHKYRLPEQSRFELMGEYYVLMADFDAAVENAKRWAGLYPDAVKAHESMAENLEQKGLWDEAVQARQEILDVEPDDHDQLHSIADLLEKKGDFDAALEYHERYADLFPDDYRSFTWIGAFYSNRGDYARAKGFYEKALLIEPEKTWVRVQLGRIEVSLGNFDGALRLYEESLAQSSTPEDSSTVLYALYDYHKLRGQSRLSAGICNRWLEEQAKFQPPLELVFSRIALVRPYVEVGDTATAFSMIDQIASDVSMALLKPAIRSGGRLFTYWELDDSSNAGRMESALRTVEAFVELTGIEDSGNDAQFSLVRAALHRWSGRYEEALAKLDEVVAALPRDDRDGFVDCNTERGRCCRLLGRFQEAETYLLEALRLGPFDPRVHFETALLYKEWGKAEKAFEHLDKALYVWKDAEPDHVRAKRARETLESWRRSA